MGDQNAPERMAWAIRERDDSQSVTGDPILASRAALRGLPVVELVDVAAYDRAITERDEARAGRNGAAKLLARAILAVEQLGRPNASTWHRYVIDGGVMPAALTEGEQPEYGPGAGGVGVPCELDGDVHGEWCDHEGEQPAGETATADDEGHALECRSLIDEIEDWTYGSLPGHALVSYKTAVRIVAALRRPAAGVQSTTVPRAFYGPERPVVEVLRLPGKGEQSTTETGRDWGALWDVERRIRERHESTTETATGETLAERIERAADLIASVQNEMVVANRREWRSTLTVEPYAEMVVAMCALLRTAPALHEMQPAAPATPEDER